MEEITGAVRVLGEAEQERSAARPPTVLELCDAGCARGPDRALERVDLRVGEGDMHLLVGERGAGKSTVLELFAGLAWPDRGQLLVRNWPTRICGPGDALDLGIGYVPEEPARLERLTIAERVVLGSEPGRCGHLDRRRAVRQVRELASRLGIAIEPRARARELSLADRRLVEVLALARRGVEVLLLDEPTSGLGSGDTARLLAALDGLRSIGRCLLIASRSPGALLDLADRITVLRQGSSVATMPASGDGRRRAAGLVREARRPLAGQRPAASVGETVLQIKGLWVAEPRKEPATGVDLEVHRGEVHGVIDTTGQGALALAESVAGLRHHDGGHVYLGDDDLERLSAHGRRALGLGYLPPPDEPGGLVGSLRLWENTALGPHRRGGLRPPRPAPRRALVAITADHAARMGVDADPSTLAGRLTRGERQLMALARELDGRVAVLDGRVAVLVAACPTRGLDRRQAELVWARLREARDAGAAVLLATTDTEELLATADRVTVMAGWRVAGELDGCWLCESELARAMAPSPSGSQPDRLWAQAPDQPPDQPPEPSGLVGPAPGWPR
jgi:simple sugar transport system ATP-binding protein